VIEQLEEKVEKKSIKEHSIFTSDGFSGS